MLTMQIKLQEIAGSVLFLGYFGLEFVRNYRLAAQNFILSQSIFSKMSSLQFPLKMKRNKEEK